jgi:hypothetical protein
MEYEVVTEGNPNEVWATGFQGESGKEKAQKLVDNGYFHLYMYKTDKDKKLIVIGK